MKYHTSAKHAPYRVRCHYCEEPATSQYQGELVCKHHASLLAWVSTFSLAVYTVAAVGTMLLAINAAQNADIVLTALWLVCSSFFAYAAVQTD